MREAMDRIKQAEALNQEQQSHLKQELTERQLANQNELNAYIADLKAQRSTLQVAVIANSEAELASEKAELSSQADQATALFAQQYQEKREELMAEIIGKVWQNYGR